MSRYPTMIYGWCLLRILHFVLVALRAAHPTKKIFISKYDFSDAYKRVAHSARSMVRTIIVLRTVAFIALRMTFGGSANPPAWCALSEMITDLANEIACISDWDHTTIKSPVPNMPEFKELSNDIPFATSRPMAVSVPVTLTSRHDCFIDDVIQIFLDTLHNQARMPSIVLLAIHVTCRPHAGDDEPVPRRPLLSPSKLHAEGAPAEIQIVLGWALNTRDLLLSLPADKFKVWSVDLLIIIDVGIVARDKLESLIGRLNHASFVIPLSRHFLNRLRTFLKSSAQGKQQFTLASEDIADLQLWVGFLSRAHEGISLNRIVK
jgi:hypothetical protein